MKRRCLMHEEIQSDSLTWSQVFNAIDTGVYKQLLSIGDCVPLDCGTYGVLNMQVVAFDVDDIATGGKAPITWIAREALAANRSLCSASSQFTWADSGMRTFLRGDFFNAVPQEVSARVLEVTKYSRTYSSDGSGVSNNDVSTDTIWIPSAYEVGATTAESLGVTYNTFFEDNASRQKAKISDTENYYQWRLRTFGTSNGRTYCVKTDGTIVTNIVKTTGTGSAVVPCFCT